MNIILHFALSYVQALCHMSSISATGIIKSGRTANIV